MKGFLFEKNRTDAYFWITPNGSISRRFHESFIGCVVLDKKNNPELLMQMILSSQQEKVANLTVEDWNNM